MNSVGWGVRESSDERTSRNTPGRKATTPHLETKEQLQQKIQEQDKKHRDNMQEVNQKVKELEKRLQDQDNLREQEYKKLQQKLQDQEKKLSDQDKEHKEEQKNQKQKLEEHFNLKLSGLANKYDFKEKF